MAKLLVNIDMADLEAGMRFYMEALGLRVGRRFGPYAAELLGLEAPIYLLVKRPGKLPFEGATQGRDYARHWTPVHFDVAVENLEEAMARAEKAGAKREGEVGSHAWGTIAAFSDPFGHGFCLLQFTERGYDAIATDGDFTL